MALRRIDTTLPGVWVFEPDVFGDARGYFAEVFHGRRYAALGLDVTMVQLNVSHSARGTLRGLHYQIRHAQAKLINVIRGEIYDVAVDVRRGSPTFGRWEAHRLSAENHRQLFIPAGFAHGFCVVSEEADVLYQCSDFYSPADERGVLWSDPTLAIPWPVAPPILSDRDRAFPTLAQARPEDLPTV